MSDEPRFKFVHVNEFVAQKPAITERDLERAYRRGYTQGYYAAANDAASNNAETLADHAEGLYWRWRVPFDRKEASEHLPPSIGALKKGVR